VSTAFFIFLNRYSWFTWSPWSSRWCGTPGTARCARSHWTRGIKWEPRTARSSW